MRDSLAQHLDHDIELIAGDNGIFNIMLGEDFLYSKKITGRFPNDKEIQDIIESINSR